MEISLLTKHNHLMTGQESGPLFTVDTHLLSTLCPLPSSTHKKEKAFNQSKTVRVHVVCTKG